jgi:guanine nucleotide-binding protein subunit alpha
LFHGIHVPFLVVLYSLLFLCSRFLIIVSLPLFNIGQAESGKSTILRNFQLKYAPSTFHAEAEAWRAIIDLNLVRSVTFLLRLLDEDSAASSAAAGEPGPPVAGSSSGAVSGASSISSKNYHGIGVGFAGGNDEDEDARPLSPSGTKLVPLQRLTDDLRRLRVSLSPLRSIEESLVRIISPDAPRGSGAGAGAGSRSSALPTERAFEVRVRSGSRWKALFKGAGGASGAAAMSKMSARGYEELLNTRRVIEACREDIVALWNHPAVRASLAEQSVALEFQSGLYVYFLNSSGTLPALRLHTLFLFPHLDRHPSFSLLSSIF